MVNSQRNTIEGWIDKASNQLQIAEDNLKSIYRCSEVVEAAQECIELSVKSVLSLLEIKFSPSHGWEQDKKQFDEIVTQIKQKQLLKELSDQSLNYIINLPRLLFLINFWSQFYITAKYGFETGQFASAKDLFKTDEANLAVIHARECYQAATKLRYLGEEEMAALK